MKLIIAGSRKFTDKDFVFSVLNSMMQFPREVVCGKARGVDTIGELWAKSKCIKVSEFPAFWGLYGKKAGFLRNQEMANYADSLIAFWDGESKGTASMIKLMEDRNKSVTVVRICTP